MADAAFGRVLGHITALDTASSITLTTSAPAIATECQIAIPIGFAGADAAHPITDSRGNTGWCVALANTINPFLDYSKLPVPSGGSITSPIYPIVDPWATTKGLIAFTIRNATPTNQWSPFAVPHDGAFVGGPSTQTGSSGVGIAVAIVIANGPDADSASVTVDGSWTEAARFTQAAGVANPSGFTAVLLYKLYNVGSPVNLSGTYSGLGSGGFIGGNFVLYGPDVGSHFTFPPCPAGQQWCDLSLLCTIAPPPPCGVALNCIWDPAACSYVCDAVPTPPPGEQWSYLTCGFVIAPPPPCADLLNCVWDPHAAEWVCDPPPTCASGLAWSFTYCACAAVNVGGQPGLATLGYSLLVRDPQGNTRGLARGTPDWQPAALVQQAVTVPHGGSATLVPPAGAKVLLAELPPGGGSLTLKGAGADTGIPIAPAGNALGLPLVLPLGALTAPGSVVLANGGAADVTVDLTWS